VCGALSQTPTARHHELAGIRGRKSPVFAEQNRVVHDEDMATPPSKMNAELAQLRDRSKRLYGNADRLQVAYAVAQSSGVVHAQELADLLAIGPPRVRAQLLAFVEAGVMRVLLEESMSDPKRTLGMRSALDWSARPHAGR
jgi:hypothetical protein